MQAVESKEYKVEKIEVTPQMIEAGEAVYLDFDPLYDCPLEFLEAVYRAMRQEMADHA